jgi:MFS family permease
MGVGGRLLNWGRLLTLSIISALRGVRDNLRLVVWQPFAVSLGLDMKAVGSLESLTDFTRILTEPSFGSVSDAVGRKRLLVVREALMLASGLMFLLARSWHLLFIGMILNGLSNALYSVWSSVIAESSEPDRLAFVYSVVGACYTGVGLLGTLGAGYMADAFGYGWVYTAASGFGLASLLIVWLRLPETMIGEPRRVNWGKAIAALAKALNPPKRLRGFYLAMGLDLVAFGMGVRLLSGMLSKGYGYTGTMIGLYTTAMTLTMAVGQIPFGRLADRFGYARFLAASQFTACVMLAMMIYSKQFEVVLVANLILGVANAFWMPAEQAWIAANVNPEERAQALGSFSTFRGLIGLPAPLIGGALFDAYGFDVPIAMNLIIALIDGILILVLVKDKPRT